MLNARFKDNDIMTLQQMLCISFDSYIYVTIRLIVGRYLKKRSIRENNFDAV